MKLAPRQRGAAAPVRYLILSPRHAGAQPEAQSVTRLNGVVHVSNTSRSQGEYTHAVETKRGEDFQSCGKEGVAAHTGQSDSRCAQCSLGWDGRPASYHIYSSSTPYTCSESVNKSWRTLHGMARWLPLVNYAPAER